MTLQDTIKKDLTTAMKEKNEDRKSALRVVLGEFARMEQKTLADDDVIKVLRKLMKSEKEVMEKTGAIEATPFMKIIESYLPQMAPEEEIREWISSNIDFSQFKNKMQAMGGIMKHFGSRADGNQVKQILQSM